MIASEKIYQTTISLYLKIRFEVNEKNIFSSEKTRNSGNCVYDYAHMFIGEDF